MKLIIELQIPIIRTSIVLRLSKNHLLLAIDNEVWQTKVIFDYQIHIGTAFGADSDHKLQKKMQDHQPLSSREKTSIFLPLIVAMALAGGIWLGYLISGSAQPASDSFVIMSDGEVNYKASRGKFNQIMNFIDSRYLEEEDLGKLEEEASEAILEKLDPHSRYISLEQIQGVQESLSGNFSGIGVEFFILDDTIYVVNVIEGGPSEKAGILDGDKIVTINDSLVAGKGVYNSDVMDKLKGEENTSVTIGIKRAGEPEIKQIAITRGKIPVRSLDVAYMLDDKTGIIKINRFSSTTYDEFMQETKRLVEEEKMQNLVLDLRRNPGGYLDQAVKMLDQLFNTKKLLVYTEGRRYDKKEYFSTGNNKFNIDQIVVLIDEGSASASEIMAGAIQDNDRGLIIGRRTFGKGLVQEQYNLSDGSALRLTVAKYFTPAGRYIQKPYDKGGEEYGNDLQDRFDSGELYYQDSIQILDSTQYLTTTGRVMYGGGGIMPDIFIPLDTLYRNNYYLAVSTYIATFVYKYTDNNRKKILAQYPNFQDFKRSFNISPALFEQFITFTEQKDIKRDNQLLFKATPKLKMLLKATLSRQLYTDQEHYQVLFDDDAMVQRALTEINRKVTE